MVNYWADETRNFKAQYLRIHAEENNWFRKSRHHTSALSFNIQSNGNVTSRSTVASSHK